MIVAKIWNYIGIGLVITIVTIAVLSFPQFAGVVNWEDKTLNEIVAYIPFIWLPGFLVPLAILLHIVSLKQINQED